uniref:Uncharacterized protein n=1 Tax=Cajanus cajan TaxID=3821 RepID=A0A151RG73_CAJCA|nr:hypothetical protein KK1_037054 [Cajanus cajan]
MGKAQLVNAVILRMLLYSFHLYSWPKMIMKQVEPIVRNFIWSGDSHVSDC